MRLANALHAELNNFTFSFIVLSVFEITKTKDQPARSVSTSGGPHQMNILRMRPVSKRANFCRPGTMSGGFCNT